MKYSSGRETRVSTKYRNIGEVYSYRAVRFAVAYIALQLVALVLYCWISYVYIWDYVCSDLVKLYR